MKKTHKRKYISTWQIPHSYNICPVIAFLLDSRILISAIVSLIFCIFYTFWIFCLPVSAIVNLIFCIFYIFCIFCISIPVIVNIMFCIFYTFCIFCISISVIVNLIFCIFCISISVIVNHRSPEAAQYTHPSRADKCPKWLIDLWIQIDCLTFPFANRDLKKSTNRFLNILLVTTEAGRPRISWGKWLIYSMNTAITFVEYYSIQIHQLTFKFFQLRSSEMKVIHCWWPQ